MDMKEKLLHMFAISLIVLLAEVSAKGLELNGQVTRPNATCNIFEGSWVYGDSYPLYDSSKCPFIDSDYDYQKHKRMQYRWQPSACNIPKFNAKDFLKRFKGKNIMFVGDILCENMFLSLTCMIHSAHPKVQYTSKDTDNGHVQKFRLPAHNVSILLSLDGFLVDQEWYPHRGKVLYLDKIKDDKMWKNQDILIFNSWDGWFDHTPIGINFQIGNQTVKGMDRLVAFEKVMRTWANWIDSNINPSKTKVFYQSVFRDMNGSQWGDPTAKNCMMETKPVQGSKYPGGPHPSEIVVKKILKSMKTPVYLLDFTRLSQLRKDGNPRRYTYENSGMDYWCLPGVPDTWNELFYAALLQS